MSFDRTLTDIIHGWHRRRHHRERCWRIDRLLVLAAAILISLPTNPAFAATTNDPARVRIHVRDHEGNPVPNCEVIVRSNYFGDPVRSGEVVTGHVTDETGKVACELRYPEVHSLDGISWDGCIQIERDGLMKVEEMLNLFPGAQLEKAITLVPKQTTLIRLSDSNGQPLESVDVEVGDALTSDRKYSGLTTIRTDNRGECNFVHAPLKGQILVIVNAVRRTFSQATEVNVQLSEIEVAALSPLRILEGRLLLDDGSPAVGWRVASEIVPPKGFQPTPCCTGCPPPFHWTDVLVARRLESVGPDGRFRVRQRDQDIVFVSPQGMPLRYPLAPQSWTEGVRRVTVQLPPVRRVHRAQLVFEDGSPVTNATVFVTEIRSRSDYSKDWSVSFNDPSDALTQPGYQSQVQGAQVDSNGWYEVPVYSGSRPRLSFTPLGFYGLSGDLIDTQRSVLHPMNTPSGMFPSEPFRWRRVTFTFRDEQGEHIPDMQAFEFQIYQGEQLLYTMAGGWHPDARGGSVFFDPRTDRIEVTTSSPGWKPLVRTFTFKGDEDPLLTITVPESHRLPCALPIEGLVLAPDSKPVTNAHVRLLRPQILPGHGFSMRSSYSWGTTIDTNGFFSFPDAPDHCEIGLSRIASDGITETLPGWSEPVKVTLDDRRPVIQLQSSGSVQVLLPEHLPCVEGLMLQDQFSTNTVPLGCDGTVRSLRAPSVRPSMYRLFADGDLPYAALLAATNPVIKITPGQESLLDFRSVETAVESSRVWTDIQVLSERKPRPGVIVSAYDRISRIARPFFEDLTDEEGRVRLPLELGQQSVVVARDVGRSIGHVSVPSSTDQAVRLEMKPARTLVVRLNEWKADPGNFTADSRTVTLRMLDTPAEEVAALYEVLALTEDEVRARFESHQQRREYEPSTNLEAHLIPDRPLVFLAEDLPVGARIEVRVSWYGHTNAIQREVVIEDGSSTTQELFIEAPVQE